MKYSVGKPAEDPDNTKYTPWLIRDASRVAIAFFQPSVFFCFGKGPLRKNNISEGTFQDRLCKSENCVSPCKL